VEQRQRQLSSEVEGEDSPSRTAWHGGPSKKVQKAKEKKAKQEEEREKRNKAMGMTIKLMAGLAAKYKIDLEESEEEENLKKKKFFFFFFFFFLFYGQPSFIVFVSSWKDKNFS